MKLNHINLFSHDVLADQAMFESYFGLKTLVVRADRMAIMQDDDGLVLIVNNPTSKLDGFAYPDEVDLMHIGFIQKDHETVDAMHARLVADGWDVPPPRQYHGAWTFYLRAKGGYFVEIGTETPVRPREAYQAPTKDDRASA